MRDRPWIIYLHRLGYVTTLIVALQLAAIAYVTWHEWHISQVQNEARRQASMMRAGTAERWIYDRMGQGGHDAWAMMKLLSPQPKLSPDGFRFVALPSFGDREFGVEMKRTPAGVNAMLVLAPVKDAAGKDGAVKDGALGDGAISSAETDHCHMLKQGDAAAPAVRKIAFRLTTAQYDQLVSTIDEIADTWRGDDSATLDGTWIIWERTRGGRVAVGMGNHPHFYGDISAAIYAALQPHVPELAHLDSSWHPKNCG